MKLNVLLDESRFIVSPDRPGAPLMFPPLEFGNVIPIELHAWQKTPFGGVAAVDISSYEISLLVGPPNTRPTLGFWEVTTTAGTSPQIAARATAEDVAAALADAFGPVTVEGGNGSYLVTVDAAGVWALPSATFQGNTLSGVIIMQITPGTATTSAQYRMEVLEVAPARIVPANWDAGSTTAVNTLAQVDGLLWRLTLDPNVNAGFFSLTVDGEDTDFLSVLSGAYQIQVALAAAGKTAQVEPDGIGGFFIVFAAEVTAASVGGTTVILPFQEANLDLTSTGIRELLDGLQFTPVKVSVMLVKDGVTETVASTDMVLQMPINQPATITIDAPQMAGITFAISDDGAYMHTYINGELTYDIPLNQP